MKILRTGLIPSGLPVTGQAKSGINSHFNRLHLIRFWLQLRYSRFAYYSVLWDYLKAKVEIPILGNPDIILYDEINSKECVLENFVIIEWEYTEKSSQTMFDRLNELTDNHDAIFFLIASDNIKILKKYANVVRKCVPGSSYYKGKKTFKSSFLNFDYHTKRLWFVHWDPLKQGVGQSGIEDARCLRFDHDEFDVFAPIKKGYNDKKTSERIYFNRFNGRTEWKLSDIMNVLNKRREKKRNAEVKGSQVEAV
jgi:hypothetical protein